MTRPHFLSDAPDSPGAQQTYEQDLTDDGYVMNVTRLWAHDPEAHQKLFDLMRRSRSGRARLCRSASTASRQTWQRSTGSVCR